MSTLDEIVEAASLLSMEDRQKLLLSVANSLNNSKQPRPEPRTFTKEQVEAWIKEDEEAMQKLRRQP